MVMRLLYALVVTLCVGTLEVRSNKNVVVTIYYFLTFARFLRPVITKVDEDPGI